MTSEAIILIVDDLMFLPKLESTLNALNYKPLVATDEVALNRAIGAAPVLAIVDLFSQTIDWQSLIGFIKGHQKKANHVPVLGFGPHVDLELREQALAAGCDAVVGRGAIAGQLPQLIEKHKWVVDAGRCQDAPPKLLVEGIELFNTREFFDCHEVIEEAWNKEQAPVRVMYQGILQIGVACYHVQNKNWRGAMKLLERGIPKTQRFAPTCMGLDLAALVTAAEAIKAELVRLGPEWQGQFDDTLFPTITLPQN
ncbi:MAG: DUF309 domain-containing protein [Anaerolineae bacterium]|nr:DUF309 domain-containing protein [Anaerolineae bacterium]